MEKHIQCVQHMNTGKQLFFPLKIACLSQQAKTTKTTLIFTDSTEQMKMRLFWLERDKHKETDTDRRFQWRCKGKPAEKTHQNKVVTVSLLDLSLSCFHGIYLKTELSVIFCWKGLV